MSDHNERAMSAKGTTVLAYHNDPAIKRADALTLRAIACGVLTVNTLTGSVTGSRWRPKAPRGCLNTKGYVVFTLHLNGERAQIKTHRAVWLASGRTIPDGFVLDHINRNKSDNRLSNLRLATARENARNRRAYNGDANPAARLSAADAERVRARHVVVKSYAAVAEEFGVSKSLVAQIVRRELWA